MTATAIFTWDDGSAAQVETVAPIIDGYGWHATLYLTLFGSTTDWTDRKSWADELYGLGWDIGNHTYSHIGPNGTTGNTEADCVADMLAMDAVLEHNGWERGRGHFAYPGHTGQVLTNDYRIALLDAGCLTIRTTTLGVTGPRGADVSNLACTNLTPTTTLSSATDRIDGAVITGAAVVLMGHALVQSDPAYLQWTIDDFTALCDHIAVRDVRVVSVSEWHTAWLQERCDPRSYIERPSVSTNGTTTYYYPDSDMFTAMCADATNGAEFLRQSQTKEPGVYVLPYTAVG